MLQRQAAADLQVEPPLRGGSTERRLQAAAPLGGFQLRAKDHMAWHRYSESWMPLLDRALGEVIQKWGSLVEGGTSWKSKRLDKNRRSAKAVAQFLAAVARQASRGSTRDLRREAKGGKLYIRRELLQEATRAENLDALGKYLRNAFQYLIESPTIVPRLEPAGEVAILGAGASIHAGLPTTERLLQEVKNELKEKYPSSHRALSLPAQPWSWAWRGNDIEDLLSALQARSWAHWAFQVGRGPKTDSQEAEYIRNLVSSYRNVILRMQIQGPTNRVTCSIDGCHPHWGQPDQITSLFLDRLDRCGRHHGGGRWAIISFSQDTVVEVQACERGARFWTWKNGYGFIPSGSNRDLYARIHDHRIYKPHGTVAWYREHASFPQLGACKIEEATLKKKQLASCLRKDEAGKDKSPLILVPSFFKDYEDKIIWDTIAKVCYELQHARHVRVVGFRLRNDDTLMSHLIRLSLRNNVTKPRMRPKMELIGPSADADSEGSLGRAWAPVLSALGAKGWRIERYPWKFHEYVWHCQERAD